MKCPCASLAVATCGAFLLVHADCVGASYWPGRGRGAQQGWIKMCASRKQGYTFISIELQNFPSLLVLDNSQFNLSLQKIYVEDSRHRQYMIKITDVDFHF